MKKYTKQVVFDYLLGNDIEGFEIDELENDPEFMAEVVCKDKKAYNLCSDEIKSDFNFTKKILERYKDDVDFALLIFSDYSKGLCNVEMDKLHEEQLFEIEILMRNITKNENYEVRLPFVLGTNVSFNWDQFVFDCTKENYNRNFQKKLGLGFIYQQQLYGHNKNIMNFVAERYIEQIFFDAMDLELNLHRMYKSYANYEKAGKYAVIVKYISYYDNNLADYVAKNAETLTDLNNEITRIKNNWGAYEYHLNQIEREKRFYEEQKYNRIIDRVRDYCENNFCRFDHWEALGYVADQFGVKEELRRYAINDRDVIEIINMMIDEKEIPEEEGNRVIDEILEEMKNQDDVECDIFEDISGISGKIKSIEDMRHIQRIQQIFAEELGYNFDSKKEKKSIKDDTNKVLQFKIKPNRQ